MVECRDYSQAKFHGSNIYTQFNQTVVKSIYVFVGSLDDCIFTHSLQWNQLSHMKCELKPIEGRSGRPLSVFIGCESIRRLLSFYQEARLDSIRTLKCSSVVQMPGNYLERIDIGMWSVVLFLLRIDNDSVDNQSKQLILNASHKCVDKPKAFLCVYNIMSTDFAPMTAPNWWQSMLQYSNRYAQ